MKKIIIAFLFLITILCCSCSKKQEQLATPSVPDIPSSLTEAAESISADTDLILSETEFAPENEHNGVDVQIYFTNTEQIDSDEGLPLSGHFLLASSTQVYLTGNGFPNARELTILDNSMKRTADSISFDVSLDAYPDVTLRITYLTADNYFTFSLLNW